MEKTALAHLKKLEKLTSNKQLLIAAIVVILILACLPSYYFYSQYKKTQALLQNPTQAANIESQQLVSQVGKLIELPQNQNPTIATVADITKLVDQPFFQNGQNGDKVLIYTQAKKAILYRPSENKIIEVAPVNIGSSAPTSAPAVVTTTPAVVSVAVYNGTTTSGLADTAKSKIQDSVVNTNVTNTEDAKDNYTKTVVIDLSGNQSQVATQIASALGGTVATSLPSGETNPNTDILVIVGSDFAGK